MGAKALIKDGKLWIRDGKLLTNENGDDCCCGDVCGSKDICPGDSPSTLTVSGTLEIAALGDATHAITASCSFSVTASFIDPGPPCEYEGTTDDCVNIDGDGGSAAISTINGGVDGLGGGSWAITFPSEGSLVAEKCGLSPIGSYSDTTWSNSNGHQYRYRNVVAS